MLSKKMAFSLMSLITIFALAFVAPSAMGAFDLELDNREDVSGAADFQMDRPATSLVVTIKSGQAIVLAATDVFVTSYNKDGVVLDFPVVTVSPTTASNKLTLTITLDTDDVSVDDVDKVSIRIAKDIDSANPVNADKSNAFDVNIFLVGSDDALGPTIYSMERVGSTLLPVTAATVQVIVTLSEMPKEFKKGNLSITDNATISKEPEALDPVAEDPAGFRELTAALTGLPPLRGLYDDDDDLEGIHAAILADIPTDLAEALVAYNALTTTNVVLDTALETTEPELGDSITHTVGIHPPLATYTLGLTSDDPPELDITPITPPSWLVGANDAATQANMEEAIADADIGNTDRAVAPVKPVSTEFATILALAAALEVYDELKDEYDEYVLEKALYDAYNAAVDAEKALDTAARDTYIQETLGTTVATSTGRDNMLYPYVVTIAPKYLNKDNIVLQIGAWEDTTLPLPNKYTPPRIETGYTEGRDKLTIKVGTGAAKALAAGHEVLLTNKRVIPAGGYLIVATDLAGTGINLPTNHNADDNTPIVGERSPAELKYNAIPVTLPNLESFLANGGTIDLVSPNAGLIISEIMWGSDASLATNSNSQWIEIMNTTAADIKTGDKTHKLIFYGPNEIVPAKTAAAAATPTTAAKPAALPAGVVDRVGTIDDTGAYWSLVGTDQGQSGRTGYGETASDLTTLIPTLELISMSRVTTAGLGNTAAGWTESTPPAVNMNPAAGGNRIASPGDDDFETPAEAKARLDAAKLKADDDADTAAKAADTSVLMPKTGQIYISEIMFAGGGRLPQWIEISNGSRSEQVDLSDWTITVDNAAADADVSVGATATFTIPKGTKIDPSGQYDTPSTILVVTEKGRNNLVGADAADQVLNLEEDNEVDLILAGVTTGKYTLLSDMAFMITLAPLVPKAATPPTSETVTARAQRQADEKVAAKDRADATDMVGNLGADGAAAWVLPMSEEGGRSSIIRRHIQIARGPAAPEDGTMMESWALASDTSFAQITHIRASSYYGAANDVGTPGFRAGGALPVELSQFRPARNKETGAVMITWSTQSELNNAGFFIKRSQQPNGEFQIINATMIPGAGTSSEKQSYTYEDTTAQPNVVYYYQIEDVSLDGNRQTLTRGIRLKGHVSVAGKATLTWGELKTSQ